MKKLNRWAMLAGALAGVALPGVAAADIGRADVFQVHSADPNDRAQVRNYADGITRLQKDDEEFTNEQGVVQFTPDGKYALYVEMRTGRINNNTQAPPNNMQCAVTPLETYVKADGKVSVKRMTGTTDRFLTNNNGNEYRNCNKPEIFSINEGKNWLVVYNYQPNNDTVRYGRVLKLDGTPVTIKNANGTTQNQVALMAKNNDDCSMHQSGAGEGVPYYKNLAGGRYVTRFVTWAGCNGNGNDDGWAIGTEADCALGPDGGATECTLKRTFDLSLAKREERSRGSCSISDADPSFASCCWTEGNNQPQREGVWCAGVDLSAGAQAGPNADTRLLWKERLAYRTQIRVENQNRNAYAMRMDSMRLPYVKADGSLGASEELMVRFNYNIGNNNNNRKGGRCVQQMVGVLKPTRTGFTYRTPLTDYTDLSLGQDCTHNSVAMSVFGKGDKLIPGITVLNGSQNGGGARSATLQTFTLDPATYAIKSLGRHSAGAGYDRHLYANYLGNNPGNQGRNFAGMTLVKNPFEAETKVKFFQAIAMTGKSPTDTTAALKPSSYVSIFPVAFSADAPAPGGEWQDVPGDNSTPQNPTDDPGSDTSETIGGCSTGGAQTGGIAALFLGMAAFLRRRRK